MVVNSNKPGVLLQVRASGEHGKGYLGTKESQRKEKLMVDVQYRTLVYSSVYHFKTANKSLASQLQGHTPLKLEILLFLGPN